MRKQLALLLATAAVAAATAAEPPVSLWPKGAPGEKGDIGPEADTTKPDGALVAGKRVIRLGNVSDPTLTVYSPPKEKANGVAVVVFPGGGYNILAMDLEGTEICEWLNSIGVTGVLVKYRVPARKGLPRHAAPLQDAQRALGLVRHRASRWGIDPKRIGVLGFSAGGHLAAALSNNFEKRTYEPQDEADAASCRPDFSVLIYPAYLTVRDAGDTLAPEVTVTAKTPPTILIQAGDDGVRVENSLFYYLALKNVKAPVEMHLYPAGGHGYGLRRTELLVTTWPARVEDWMRAMGFLRAAN
jgi:acetyl esterase/lipase